MPGAIPQLTTPRLRLRPWRDEDLPAIAAINSDPVVMEYFPAPLSLEETEAMIQRLRGHFEQHGFGLWAVQVIGGAECIGMIGLQIPYFEAHFTPCVEVGWRLGQDHWGQGYATEAAQACLQFGFEELGLEEIVALTPTINHRSRRVMEKLGMERQPEDDFDHPRIPPDHLLRRCVLYRLARVRWQARGIG